MVSTSGSSGKLISCNVRDKRVATLVAPHFAAPALRGTVGTSGTSISITAPLPRCPATDTTMSSESYLDATAEFYRAMAAPGSDVNTNTEFMVGT